MPALVALAETHGWSGLEPFVATPGSVGAAVLFDDAWAERVEAVGTIRRDKVVEDTLEAVRKRKTSVVVWVRLRLDAADPARVARQTDAEWAKARPPAGSWYQPPRKSTARAVLRTVRLPLVRLRRVAIPEEAPECLVNLGGGTAADLALLHRSAVDRVKSVRGLTLDARLKWLGPKNKTARR